MNKEIRPDWVDELKKRYLAGSSSFFILHGNVDDMIGSLEPDGYRSEPLADYLARRLLSAYDLVLHYDLGRGLRPHPGGDSQRLSQMNALLRRLIGRTTDLPREPAHVLRVLDRLITLILVGGTEKTSHKTAFLFDYGELICPPGDRQAENLAIFLNWARSPIVRRVNMIFILMTRSLAQLHPSLVQSGYTDELLAPMPGLELRRTYIEYTFPALSLEAARLAKLSSGLTLANLDNLLRLAHDRCRSVSSPKVEREGPAEPDPEAKVMDGREEAAAVAARQIPPESGPAGTGPKTEESRILVQGVDLMRIKKHLIEAQCPGLIEFIEPRLDLSLVAGHSAAKQRLAEDAELIRQGELEAVPMGYLICGPVGVGKTFIALCYSGTVGLPCVSIKNFRSKYVGETEANLERIMEVLRELGPVAVIIDEADAAVGNRGASGDSGTSARVFARLASQMGDTRYRGRMIWFLLTCRPDLLPIDLKRQGRCEEHIPLFYPETPEEIREMFSAMARKLGLNLDPAVIDGLEIPRALSGADIESLLTRARREALLKKRPVDGSMISDCLKSFLSSRGPEHELQWLAAILECSDLGYLPPRLRRVVEDPGGMDKLAARYRELRLQIE